MSTLSPASRPAAREVLHGWQTYDRGFHGFFSKKAHQGSSEHAAKLTTGPTTTALHAENATSPNGAELTKPRSIDSVSVAPFSKEKIGLGLVVVSRRLTRAEEESTVQYMGK